MKQAKCKASAMAASMDQRNSRPLILRNWPGSRTRVGVAMTTAPMALRQKAMASALTLVAPSVAAMSGPEDATPRTPRAAKKKFNAAPWCWFRAQMGRGGGRAGVGRTGTCGWWRHGDAEAGRRGCKAGALGIGACPHKKQP